MSTTSVGRAIETAVADHLTKKGYKLLDQNWRTRSCEIDLVLGLQDTVYFVEVKFRKIANSGEGIEYITPKKLKQMRYAAEFWCAKNKWDGDCVLMVASVDGERSLIKFIELD